MILLHHISLRWTVSIKWKSQHRMPTLATTYQSSNTQHKWTTLSTNRRSISKSQLLSRIQLLILALNSYSLAMMKRFSGLKMKATIKVSNWSFSAKIKQVRKTSRYAKARFFIQLWQTMRVTFIPTIKARQGRLSQPYRACSIGLSPSHSFGLAKSLAYTSTVLKLEVRCLKSEMLYLL